jgi:hypothetical protein
VVAADGAVCEGYGLLYFLSRPGFDGGSEPTEEWISACTEEVPDELRERALRLVWEVMAEAP